MWSKNSLNVGSILALIFLVNWTFSIKVQRYDFTKLALTISALINFGTTGNSFQKSPPKTMTFLPNGNTYKISPVDVSIVCHLAIVTSPHIIIFSFLINLTTSFFFDMFSMLINLFEGGSQTSSVLYVFSVRFKLLHH